MDQNQINEIKWAAQAALTTAQDNEATAQAAVESAQAALTAAQEAVAVAQTALNDANELAPDAVPTKWWVSVEDFSPLLTSGGALDSSVAETVLINGTPANYGQAVALPSADLQSSPSGPRWETTSATLEAPAPVDVQIGSDNPFQINWKRVE